MYGETWIRNYGESTDPDGVWFEGLRDLSLHAIAHGLKECLNSGSDFPPSLPKFRDMCLEFDPVPSFDDCFKDACHQCGSYKPNWTHIVTYNCALKVGFFNIKTSSASKLEPLFKRVYKQIVHDFRNGVDLTPLPGPTVKLPPPKLEDESVVEKKLEELKGMFK